MQKHLPPIIIFVIGLITMVFEMVGARALGPYFGTSIFVWTSLIGIVMGSLSVGYWLGGILSVRKTNFQLLGLMLILSGILVALTALSEHYILERVIKYIPGFKFQIIFSVILLFAPASILFGMILPYSIRLKMENLSTSGAIIGNLYALSTVGSIVGTFAAGFILVPFFGYANILFFLSFILFSISAVLFLPEKKFIWIAISSVLIILSLFTWNYKRNQERTYVDVDTQYNRVLIYETTDRHTDRPIRMLKVNDENSSAMFLDGDDGLVFKVLKYYHLVEHFVPDFQNSLMIGGSGYAFPKAYLKTYPDANLDVVEIDPGLTALAREYFELKDNPNLNIYHEDGRIFLNDCEEKKYDAIFMDAYKSMLTIPYQLTTQEAIRKISDALTDNGAVFANVISSLDNKTNEFLRAELATYRSVFPQVMLFAVQYPNPTDKEKSYFQNIMLVGLKSPVKPEFVSENEQLNDFLSNLIELNTTEKDLIITDEYAPVEYFASKVLN